MLAWHQYSELIALRAGASTNDQSADLQKKIADLQKSNRELEEQLAALRASHEDGLEDMAAAEERPARPAAQNGGQRNGRNGRGEQQAAAMRELLARPDVQAMIAAEQKAQLDGHYAALFKKLNLTPEQADKLKALLIERRTAQQDVVAAAREQGINPRTDRDAFAKLVADAQAPVNANIKALIGDTGFSELGNYEKTAPQRNLVNSLQQRLGYGEPLTANQADQLVQILASTAPQRAAGATGGDFRGGNEGGFGGPGGFAGRIGGFVGGGVVGGGFNSVPITAEAVNRAQTVLTPSQLSALQQMQQQQQTAQQLQQLFRSTFQQNNANAGATGAQAGTNTGGGGRRRGGGG